MRWPLSLGFFSWQALKFLNLNLLSILTYFTHGSCRTFNDETSTHIMMIFNDETTIYIYIYNELFYPIFVLMAGLELGVGTQR